MSLGTLTLPKSGSEGSFCFSTIEEIATGSKQLSKRSKLAKKFLQVLDFVFNVVSLTGSDMCLKYTLNFAKDAISLDNLKLEASIFDKSKMDVMKILDWLIWGPYTWLVNLARDALSRRRLAKSNSCPCQFANLTNSSCLLDFHGLEEGMEDRQQASSQHVSTVAFCHQTGCNGKLSCVSQFVSAYFDFVVGVGWARLLHLFRHSFLVW